MKTPSILAIVSLSVLLPVLLLGCDDPEADPMAEACAMACDGFSMCEGEVMTAYPIYFDVDICIDEFCAPGDTVVDPPGRGDEICNESLSLYLECVNGMTCQDWDDSDIVSVFAGASAAGCDDEADDFVLDCIAFAPF